MNIPDQLANMSDPFEPKRWSECAFRGCADWVAPGRVYCRRHAPQVEAKLGEIADRVLQARQMPPVPVIVDVEEASAVPVYRRTLSADYDPCDDPKTWKPVGPLETILILAPPLCAGLFGFMTFGSIWIGDGRLAALSAVLFFLSLLAPLLCRWSIETWGRLMTALSWGLGE